MRTGYRVKKYFKCVSRQFVSCFTMYPAAVSCTLGRSSSNRHVPSERARKTPPANYAEHQVLRVTDSYLPLNAAVTVKHVTECKRGLYATALSFCLSVCLFVCRLIFSYAFTMMWRFAADNPSTLSCMMRRLVKWDQLPWDRDRDRDQKNLARPRPETTRPRPRPRPLTFSNVQ